MSWWNKFGCMLTGWSSTVLAQCSEASKCQLSKYTSALLILMIIWSVTGFCFAQRYIELPLWGCILVSFAFVTIVVMIERQIILANGRNRGLIVFRIAIAVVMAMVGSTILDQTMFGKDIDKQMANNIETQVAELSQKRVHIIDDKLVTLHAEIDSIENVNAALQADVNANPFVTQKSVTNSQEKLVLPDGKIETVNNPSVTTNQVPNPKYEVLESNKKVVADMRVQETEWTKEKQNIEETVRTECRANVGFLEELEAMWTIVSTRKTAAVFYGIFFCLLMSMELFVVASKVGDKECDYDVAIRGGQLAKTSQFSTVYGRVGVMGVSNC